MPSPQHFVRYLLNSPWRKTSFMAILTLGLLSSLVACVPPERKDGAISDICSGSGDEAAIFGGRKASQNSWLGRSLVFILNDDLNSKGELQTSACTGTLIDQSIVLTAAHCVNSQGKAGNMKVLFTTEPKCGSRMDGTDPAITRYVSEIHVPVAYKDNEAANDIALIRLTGSAPISYQITPLAGTAIPFSPTTNILLAGFGKSLDYNQQGPNERDLKFVYVNPVTKSIYTNEIFQMDKMPYIYSDQRNGHGACAGDSGGPAFTKNQNGQYVQVGVAGRVLPLDYQWNSDLDTTCHQGILHTNVLYHRQWIEQKYQTMRSYESKTTPFVD